jgi:catechol 2,3-dioxygenase-like lactoylglutathione lyase family enzyme
MADPLPTYIGVHHVCIPVSHIERSCDWYERVLNFRVVIYEETEDAIVAATLEHRSGLMLCLLAAPVLARTMVDFCPLSLAVPDQEELGRWQEYLANLAVEHSPSRPANVGWALDVIDPDGIKIQLHTHETISIDIS